MADLTRELIEGDGLRTLMAEDAPSLRLRTVAELEASLRCTLASRPPGDVWVFAYGSLLWNATVHPEERRWARVEGWRRTFCLSVVAGRGSPEQPGLALGLEPGGSCEGMALRIADQNLEQELRVLWRRELVSGDYTPAWVQLQSAAAEPFGHALAFTIDTAGPGYVEDLADDELLVRLTRGSGRLGTALDYLLRTRDALREQGIYDAHLEDLARQATATSGL